MPRLTRFTTRTRRTRCAATAHAAARTHMLAPPSWSAAPAAERVLAAAGAVLLVLAVVLPAAELPAGYHQFADQRPWGALPHAVEVLTNAAFVLMGGWGACVLRRVPQAALPARPRALAALFLAGLVTAGLASAAYHWAPDDAGLFIDRLGMAPAFAGLLGLAVAEHVSCRAGWRMAAAVLLAAPLTAWLAWRGNMTPWALLQGGAMVLLAALAWRRPLPVALGVSLWPPLACYAVAKVLELADAPVFALTQGWIGGHALKHLVAALAAWPVLVALRKAQKMRG